MASSGPHGDDKAPLLHGPKPPQYSETDAANVHVQYGSTGYGGQPVPSSSTQQYLYPTHQGPAYQVQPPLPPGPAPSVILIQEVPQSFIGHVALACFVTWCCNVVFGVIAFVLAMLGQSAAQEGNAPSARQFGRASLWMSIVGIVVTIVIVVILVAIYVNAEQHSHK